MPGEDGWSGEERMCGWRRGGCGLPCDAGREEENDRWLGGCWCWIQRMDWSVWYPSMGLR